MKKLSKACKALSLILRKPVLLNRVLQEPNHWKEHLDNRYNLSHGLAVTDPSELFDKKYNEDLKLFTFLDGGSLVTDIALLKGLARKYNNCRYFEIGTWRGESAVNLADVASEVFTLNLSANEMRELGVSEETIAQQGMFSKDNKKIIHLKGNSRTYNFAAIAKKFDLIFVDGSHHYEDVKNDTEKVFKHLVHDNSIVVWHDYGVTPEDVRYEVLAGILDGSPPEIHTHLYHVAHTKSAIFLREQLKTESLQKPFNPHHYYTVNIKYRPIEKG